MANRNAAEIYFELGGDRRLIQARNQVIREDGCDLDYVGKSKSLSKFGESDVIGTSLTTVQSQGGNEVYVSDNLIDAIVSSSVSDDQEVVVEGHTIDGNGDFTFVTQSVTLNGQTPVALPTPMARVNRAYNNNSTDLDGLVTVYQDTATVSAGVPQESALVHLEIEGNGIFNQSRKAATTVSKDDYWIITGFNASCLEKQAAFVEVVVEIREKGGVFRAAPIDIGLGAGDTTTLILEEPIIVKPNSDVRVRAFASGNSTGVSATLYGPLAFKRDL